MLFKLDSKVEEFISIIRFCLFNGLMHLDTKVEISAYISIICFSLINSPASPYIPLSELSLVVVVGSNDVSVHYMFMLLQL